MPFAFGGLVNPNVSLTKELFVPALYAVVFINAVAAASIEPVCTNVPTPAPKAVEFVAPVT